MFSCFTEKTQFVGHLLYMLHQFLDVYMYMTDNSEKVYITQLQEKIISHCFKS